MLELRHHELHNVLDASTGSLLCLCDGPVRHCLWGDLGVSASEACQHVLCHRLHQSMTLGF
jgi:hypothetical protein